MKQSMAYLAPMRGVLHLQLGILGYWIGILALITACASLLAQDIQPPGRRIPVHNRKPVTPSPAGGTLGVMAAGEGEEDTSPRFSRTFPLPPGVRPRLPAGQVSAPFFVSGPVQTGTSFEGIDFLTSSCGCLPPDSCASVGKDYVVEVVNVQMRVFDKATGAVLLDQPLATLFGAPTGGDPYVVYDDTADRWYISAFNSADSGLFLSVSRGGDPLDGFLPAYELTNVGGFPDYQKLGFSKDAIFISYNDFGSGGGSAAIATIDKAAALSGSLIYYVSMPLFQFRAMPPAQMHGDTTGGVEWFVSTDGTDAGGNSIRVTRMENYLSSSPSFTYTSLPVTQYGQAGSAEQPGGTVTVFPNTTTTQVHYRNGQLVTAMSSGQTSEGFVYPKGLYYQVDVSGGTPTLVREGLIDPGLGVAVQMPTVDLDLSGNLGLSWMESSGSEYLSMWVGAVDVSGSLAASVAAPGGGFFYQSFRIGDYSTTVLDPADGGLFWSANEYIGTDGDTDIWRTFIASFSLGMTVSKTSPANGDIVTAPPTEYVVAFSAPFDPNSVSPAGVLVNGVASDAYTIIDERTISFRFAANPVVSQGLQHFDLAAGAVKRLSDGDPLRAYASTFRYDLVRIQVVSTTPADGTVATLPLTSLVLTLNEAYDPTSVSISDLSLSVGTVQSFEMVNANTIKYLLTGIIAEGTLSFSLRAGCFTDTFGNPSLPCQGSLILDYGTQPVPVPLTALKPAGSLVYQTALKGIIFPSGDTDTFTIDIDPGQTLTVIVEPQDPSLRPTVTVVSPDGASSASAAPAPNKDAVLQTFRTAGMLFSANPPTRYQVVVGGADGSSGHYSVRLVLNAAAELEQYDGPGNDTRAAAQSLESSFVTLGTLAPKPERGAVFGTTQRVTQAGDVFATVRSYNFFGGSVLSYNSAGDLVLTIQSPEFDRGVLSDIELGPGNVIYVALSTDFFSGSTVKGEILKFDLRGRFLGSLPLPDDPANVGYLYPFGFDVAPDGTLWVPQLNSGNVVHVNSAGELLASYPVGLQPQDASVSPSGSIFVSYVDFSTYFGKVLQLDPRTGQVSDFVSSGLYSPAELNATADGGAWLGDVNDALKFDSAGGVSQQIFEYPALDVQEDPSGAPWIASFYNGLAKYDSAGNLLFRRVPTTGYVVGLAVAGVDSADPLPPPLADFYSFNLKAGQTATVVLALLEGSTAEAELQDSSGGLLAQGSATKSKDCVLGNCVADTTGTYYLKITGSGSYSLVVARNAAFNDWADASLATAQPLTTPNPALPRVVLGYLAAGTLDYSGGFANPDGLQANGTTAFVGGVGQLTDGSFSEAGSFFSANRVDVRAFSTTFAFQIVPGTIPMADGMTFTINGNAATELGPGGGGLGYGPDFPGGPRGIRNSVAVKFDIYNNAGEGINSTGLFTDGRSPTVPEPGSPDVTIDLTGSGIDLNSQHPFQVDLVYDGTTLTVTITDTATSASASQSYTIDIPAQVGGDTAFVGFTGGTGGLSSVQDILAWKYNPSAGTADFYRVDLVGNRPIRIETCTPAGGAGQFVNTLDPMISLYDPKGSLVATSDNDARDHRNAVINYKVPNGAGGSYYIAIAPSTASPRPTSGEYILIQAQY